MNNESLKQSDLLTGLSTLDTCSPFLGFLMLVDYQDCDYSPKGCHIVERQLQYDKIKTVSLGSNIRVVKVFKGH
jgi:hypothetical protein